MSINPARFAYILTRKMVRYTTGHHRIHNPFKAHQRIRTEKLFAIPCVMCHK